jgi:hypothetical protein
VAARTARDAEREHGEGVAIRDAQVDVDVESEGEVEVALDSGRTNAPRAVQACRMDVFLRRVSAPAPAPRSAHAVRQALCFALAAGLLQGCDEQRAEEILLALVLLGLTLVVLNLVNLAAVGGGIATIAMNRFGTATRRSRTWGFVFGGLNIAAGVTGMLGTLGWRLALRSALPEALRGQEPTADAISGVLVSLGISLAYMALGAAGIFVAAQARPADTDARGRVSSP